MTTRRLRAYAGLERPYRFDRAIALVAALALAVVVAAAAVNFSLGDGLAFDTPRGRYFIYLGLLLAAAFALVPRPAWARLVLSLLALEIGLGMGSAMLFKLHLASAQTLMPRNYNRPTYGWHPLLQAWPMPMPTGRRTQAQVTINSQHQRGPERTPAELAARNVIALFGGSTTLDFLAPEGQSWGERLEEILGRERFAVINHGAAGYATAQNLIQTAFYEATWGAEPRCAIYYVGWNDLRSAHVPDLDAGYADFHTPGLIDALEARRLSDPELAVSPLLSLLGRLAVLLFDTARPMPLPKAPTGNQPDPALEAIYARNIHAISAINRERGIVTIWVGQLMNRAKLTEPVSSGWIAFVPDKDVWPLIERLNAVLKREAAALGDIHVDLSIDDFPPADFGDEGHFLPAGSLKFARALAPVAARACSGAR